MDKITENSLIKLDLKIIMLLITMLLGLAGGWWNISTNVTKNTEHIKQIEKIQESHMQDYQQMNKSVTEITVKVDTIKQNTKDIKDTLEYLRRKSDEK